MSRDRGWATGRMIWGFESRQDQAILLLLQVLTEHGSHPTPY